MPEPIELPDCVMPEIDWRNAVKFTNQPPWNWYSVPTFTHRPSDKPQKSAIGMGLAHKLAWQD
jgi:hypothetical protein